MANEDLKPRQNRRVGRIAENNPERAGRVADRLVTKSEREEKGKKIADRYSSSSEENYKPQQKAEQLEYLRKGSSKEKEAALKYSEAAYDAINFKNRDIDRFKGSFNQQGVRDTRNTLTLEEVEAIRKPKP